MAKKLQTVHRACVECGFVAEVVKNWNGKAPNGIIECPNCKKFTLELRSQDWMNYAYWKGTLGPGRILREAIKKECR